MYRPASLPIGNMIGAHVGAHVLVNTQNVVISRCCFAEDGYEMYQVLLCMCRAIVLLIKAFVLPRSRCRCRRGLLKVPNVLFKAPYVTSVLVMRSCYASKLVKAANMLCYVTLSCDRYALRNRQGKQPNTT